MAVLRTRQGLAYDFIFHVALIVFNFAFRIEVWHGNFFSKKVYTTGGEGMYAEEQYAGEGGEYVENADGTYTYATPGTY